MDKLPDILKDKHVPYRVNEMNSFYGGGKAGVSDTFASALWCLDYMFQLASLGCGGVNMQTDINQLGFVSHYSPIYKDKDGRVSARPEYYGMLAFALAGKDELVKLTASETPINLRAYATKNAEGHIWVTLVNKDLAQEAKIDLKLPAGCTMAEAYRLTAPSADSKTGVTLAGAAVTSEGTWTPRLTVNFVVVGNT
ncbi:MAG: glycosyl hydrolase family 79 C-terminal domain-containing protein [Candidatus Hydrogenedentes bacterium]|nr:glycosyl hydrolase family 79 C-terminal domain-containing protein [Candidatus Hydrogenedentota bacterium]